MHHFTNKDGFDGIRAAPDWLFKASQPPGDHPKGAYFTTLPPTTPALAAKLRISKEKTEYVFRFGDAGDLKPIRGGRGDYIFFSPDDYLVARARQQFHGTSVEGPHD